MKSKPHASGNRRDFLKNATLGVGAAAVAGKALSTDKAAAKSTAAPRPGSSYRETEHVKRYYELARG